MLGHPDTGHGLRATAPGALAGPHARGHIRCREPSHGSAGSHGSTGGDGAGDKRSGRGVHDE